MKRSVCILVMSLGLSTMCNAQNNDKKWSLEVNVGQNNAVRPFADNYTANTVGDVGGIDLNHFDLGIRQMITRSFGWKVDMGYDVVKNSGVSLPFKTQSYRVGVQAVFDLGKVFQFEDFSERLGLLVHVGPQVGIIKPEEKKSELNRGFMIGITPQLRLNENVALTFDFTTIRNRSQNYNWDGSSASVNNNLDGLMYNTSIGFTYFFSSKKQSVEVNKVTE